MSLFELIFKNGYPYPLDMSHDCTLFVIIQQLLGHLNQYAHRAGVRCFRIHELGACAVLERGR